jgi:hypothetical protein
MNTRLYVPFSEKECAKSTGALWDKVQKTWYIPEGYSRADYGRWLAMSNADSICLFSKSLSLAWSWESCWKCDNPSPVLMFVAKDCAETIAYNEDSDIYYDSVIPANAIISHTIFTDPSLSNIIKRYFPFYYRDRSKEAGKSYRMNHCICCGTKLGDYYMIAEPDDPFNPMPATDPLLVFIDMPNPETYYYSIAGDENFTGIDEFIDRRSVEWIEFKEAWNYKFGSEKKIENPFIEIKLWVELFYGLGKCGKP